MSRRKQSNPKPLKNELAQDALPLEYPAETEERKGEVNDWTDRAEAALLPDSNSTRGSTDINMVTVLEAPPKKSETPDRPSSAIEDDRKSPTKPELNEKQPRIRLKAGLATDPALNMFVNIKSEIDSANQITPEMLAALSPAIQSTLASQGLLYTSGLKLNEAIATIAAARKAATIDAVRVASSEAEASRPPTVPVYQCVPCGIRFSTLSTLEAHQTYYCSHRPTKATDEDSKPSGGVSEPGGNQSDADGVESSNKGLRSVKQYTCMHCSYSADKKVSLNRHMRMHTVSPGPVSGALGGTSSSSIANGESNAAEPQDRYCAVCDIRFSSQKTYRAHKMHYCDSRHVVKPTAPPSSCTSGSSPTSPVDTSSCRTPPSPTPPVPPQQPFLALPTNPIIIVPYSLFRSASVLPALSTATGIPSPDTPCFLLPNGTLQPMTSALSGVNVTTTPTTQQPQGTIDQVLKAVNKGNKEPVVTRESSSAPLDLTVRKSPELEKFKNSDDASGPMEIDSDHEKENVKRRSPSPEKIECEPSIHSSPCSTPSGIYEKSSPSLSVSPKRKLDDASRSNSPRSSKTPKLSIEKTSRTSPESVVSTGPPFDIPPTLHPLLMRAGNLPLFPPELQMRLSDLPPLPPVMPQVIVKQGVSKCKECNIVFCKHENYIVHKKHYCSARTLEDDSSKTSGSPPVSPRSGGTTSPAAQYQQLICLACGIKFTSPDNLNAHQQYYCLKRSETEPKRCGKCRAFLEPGHQCVSHSAVAGWKCPCCDTISATASAAQRHMETHTGVKAYRCTICKYKGNTLRGMKTHIRMHFDKRSPDLQEEKYISYILEDDTIGTGMEVAIAPSLSQDEISSPSIESRPEPHHLCPQCPYSSPYKANVVRHIKLVHEVNMDENLSNGEDKGTTKNMPQLDEEEEIIIKKEAMEPEVIIAQVEGATIKEEPELSTTPKSKSLDDEIMQEVAKPGAHYCKSCDIYFNYTSTFIAHKKFYCSSHAGEISNANNNNNTAPRTAETSVL